MAVSKGMIMAAAAAQLLAAGSLTPERHADRIRYSPKTGRPKELTRPQIRRADRTKKQYILKGVRP